MALTYGFYNSKDHDRMYSAEEMAGFLDGIIYDGVYQAVGNSLEVKPYDGMSVTIDSGRAWFDHTWTLNTTKYVVTLDESDPVFNRIDAVVLEVNKTDRKNYFKVVKGEPAEIPLRPALIKTNMIKQYALAYITVKRQPSTEISELDIMNVVGKPSGSASRWDITETYQKDSMVVSYSGNIYKALKNVPSGIELTDVEYWMLYEAAETPLVSALALSGIPSGGKTGQVLAKSSDESSAIGWYNINRLPSGKWYLPQGVEEEDVIAAFQFRYAEDVDEALKSINANEYILTRTSSTLVEWSGVDGFRIPNQANQGLVNTTIAASPIGTVAIKYADAETGSKQIGLIFKDRSHFILAKYYAVVSRMNDDYFGPPNDIYQDVRRPVVASGEHTDEGFVGFTQKGISCYYSSMIAENATNGILSCNFSNDTSVNNVKLYSSGNDMTLTSARKEYTFRGTDDVVKKYAAGATDFSFPSSAPLIGNGQNGGVVYGSVNVHLAVFFNRILTPNEIISLHSMMADV